MPPTVTVASGPADVETVRTLFRAYAAGLDVDLSYQGFEAELAALPGRYAAPAGALFLARGPDGAPTGCLGLRPLDRPGACELKRLYVTPAARGTGTGKALGRTALAFAQAAGYREALLDTLSTMDTAIALYTALGFRPIPPYWNNTAPDVVYFGCSL